MNSALKLSVTEASACYRLAELSGEREDRTVEVDVHYGAGVRLADRRANAFVRHVGAPLLHVFKIAVDLPAPERYLLQNDCFHRLGERAVYKTARQSVRVERVENAPALNVVAYERVQPHVVAERAEAFRHPVRRARHLRSYAEERIIDGIIRHGKTAYRKGRFYS